LKKNSRDAQRGEEEGEPIFNTRRKIIALERGGKKE